MATITLFKGNQLIVAEYDGEGKDADLVSFVHTIDGVVQKTRLEDVLMMLILDRWEEPGTLIVVKNGVVQ